MMEIKAVSMVRTIRDKQFEEIKDLKGEALRKYYREKSQWVAESRKVPSVTPGE